MEHRFDERIAALQSIVVAAVLQSARCSSRVKHDTVGRLACWDDLLTMLQALVEFQATLSRHAYLYWPTRCNLRALWLVTKRVVMRIFGCRLGSEFVAWSTT